MNWKVWLRLENNIKMKYVERVREYVGWIQLFQKFHKGRRFFFSLPERLLISQEYYSMNVQ
jgi:hypothetical protein